MCTSYSASSIKFPFLDTLYLCMCVRASTCVCVRTRVSTRYLLFDTDAEIKN
jgi:hypothetical protein